jgi:DNA-binding transcriptional LysR family regulator
MELRQLRYLVEIVERGGFSPASRAIRVAQPALTMAIQKLEREMGAKLIDRDARPVTLTADGRAFHSAAREILLRAGAWKGARCPSRSRSCSPPTRSQR